MMYLIIMWGFEWKGLKIYNLIGCFPNPIYQSLQPMKTLAEDLPPPNIQSPVSLSTAESNLCSLSPNPSLNHLRSHLKISSQDTPEIITKKVQQLIQVNLSNQKVCINSTLAKSLGKLIIKIDALWKKIKRDLLINLFEEDLFMAGKKLQNLRVQLLLSKPLSKQEIFIEVKYGAEEEQKIVLSKQL